MKTDDSHESVRWSLFLGSAFAPNFPLLLIILGCLLLPGFESCSGREVPMREMVAGAVKSPVCATIFLLPQILVVAMSAAAFCMIVFQRNRRGAQTAWWIMVLVSVWHLACLIAALITSDGKAGQSPDQTEADDILLLFLAVCYFVGPITAVIVARWRCKSLENAVLWVQLTLATAAVVTAVWVVPSICLVKRFLSGGELNVFGTIGLFLVALVQLMDGERALNSKQGESMFRLTLKQWFVLLTLACVLAAIFAGILVGPDVASPTTTQTN